jgi:hypothetical protein
MTLESDAPYRLGQFTSHHRLAAPVAPWEQLKISGGTPPVLTRHGWLFIYHGVSKIVEAGTDRHRLCYSAGVVVLANEHPRVILADDRIGVAHLDIPAFLPSEAAAGTLETRRAGRSSS